ncbi:receptor protein-tyrosine kinase CEPR1-like [Lolium rigidum]|uniref:receptor protein-tyrosine kinase CEPR1-like n=1 Tax=Lolium rigidum TaxID=89674 RepID=UPI001F5D4055|nr:receptor protein-tyrosine kinase CEPR1-like [Lolium rigidum]
MVATALCSLPCLLLAVAVLLASRGNNGAAALDAQAAYLSRLKQDFAGPAMARWDFSPAPVVDYCRFQGVVCDGAGGGNVTGIDLTSWRLTGRIPPGICAALPALRELQLGFNDIRGGFPASLLNCSSLETLNLSYSGVSGAVPDLSPMRALRELDMSNNLFTGAFPVASLVNMTSLEVVNFNENPGFDVWRPPEALTRLRRLRVLILSTTSMRGGVPAWLGNMTTLTDLELSGNFLTGRIPPSLGRLANLEFLELYYNELSGAIPDELGNLTRLADVDLSENRLSGAIPDSLCALPRLRVLQVYTNFLAGPIPAVLGNSTQLEILSVYKNQLTGELPANLGRYSDFNVLEVSENLLTGPLPPHACANGNLQYILVLSNLLTGAIPAAYGECSPLLRFRVSNNHLEGEVPPGIFALPHASIVDLSYNHFTGAVSPSIAGAKNLTSLFASDNRLSGVLPPEIADAGSLVKIDLSNNLIAGPIPAELGKMVRLNLLSLQVNRFNGTIPETLADLRSLNVLNLSENALSGQIPEALCALLPNSLDFAGNNLSGPVPPAIIKDGLLESVARNPGLCVAFRLNPRDTTMPMCHKEADKRGLAGSAWIIGACAVVCVVAMLALARRWLMRRWAAQDGDQDGTSSSSPGSRRGHGGSSYDVTSFHKLSFDQHEILEALIEKNIVGHGGSGTVYKIELSSGELVAVKKLWVSSSKQNQKHRGGWGGGEEDEGRELRTEVETLGSIRHKNIVKLYCCYSGADSNLLVYEYMPNGNLWDALHGGGWGFLDWPTRRRVAIGVAQGLAYLHHDLLFAIVHRDVKSSNILLDADFEPKVADFGIAKVIQATASSRGDTTASTTTIAGTYGYLAPEYAYSSKATTKCDVYSFGVVLMELATGRKPIEPEFGETRDIVQWVTAKVAAAAEAEALDKGLAWSPFKEEMVQALRVAVRCTCSIPGLRPTMADVVQMLAESGPTGRTGKTDVKGYSGQQQPKPVAV